MHRFHSWNSASHIQTCHFQNSVWSGHNRVHGLKFQALFLPDGMLGMLYGPVEACRHDVTFLIHDPLFFHCERSLVFMIFSKGFQCCRIITKFGDMGNLNSRQLLTRGLPIDIWRGIKLPDTPCASYFSPASWKCRKHSAWQVVRIQETECSITYTIVKSAQSWLKKCAWSS